MVDAAGRAAHHRQPLHRARRLRTAEGVSVRRMMSATRADPMLAAYQAARVEDRLLAALGARQRGGRQSAAILIVEGQRGEALVGGGRSVRVEDHPSRSSNCGGWSC
jgi:uncharacterized Ntn-hydrolase superfamily protein